jgi:hypothetical protein
MFRFRIEVSGSWFLMAEQAAIIPAVPGQTNVAIAAKL